MICLIAASYKNARRWAISQHLEDNEWFYPKSPFDLYSKNNFHTIVVPDGLEEMPNRQLNDLLTVAWKRGKIGRT